MTVSTTKTHLLIKLKNTGIWKVPAVKNATFHVFLPKKKRIGALDRTIIEDISKSWLLFARPGAVLARKQSYQKKIFENLFNWSI